MGRKEKGNNTTVKYMLIKDRIDIYKDFTFNLLYYIFDFYLDKDTLYFDDDIKNHFMFCYNKVCDEFLLEDIDFRENEKLIEYFSKYYYHHFYKRDDQPDLKYFENFWGGIFQVDRPKSKNILNVLVELYVIFDNSISLKKNNLELV